MPFETRKFSVSSTRILVKESLIAISTDPIKKMFRVGSTETKNDNWQRGSKLTRGGWCCVFGTVGPRSRPQLCDTIRHTVMTSPPRPGRRVDVGRRTSCRSE